MSASAPQPDPPRPEPASPRAPGRPRRALFGLRRALLSHHSLVLLLYLVGAWLVIFGRSTAVASHSFAGGLDHDAGTYVWYMWHFEQALLGEGQFLFSDRLFYPVGMNMFRQDWTPVTAALALPFQPLGIIAAYNLEVLLAFVLCGYFTYLLVLRLTRPGATAGLRGEAARPGGHRPYAFLAGLIFAFCEFRILKACYHGHLTHANQQFIPLFLLCAHLFFVERDLPRRRRWLAGLGAGASFFLATFCSPYQMVFLLVISVLWVLHRLVGAALPLSWPPRLRGRALARESGRVALFTLLSAGTAVVLVAPMILSISWDAVALGADSLSGFIPAFSADLLSYVIPTLGKDPGWPNFTGEGGCAFQGYTVLALSLLALGVALRHRPGLSFWLLSALVFFLLSLGSVLVVGGEQVRPLPFFALLEQIPIVRGARVAARFSVLVTLFLAVAGALALVTLERRRLAAWRPRRLWLLRGGLIAAVALELLAYRVHLTVALGVEGEPFPVPRIYREMAKDADDYSVLVYPLTWEVASANIGPLHFPRQYYYYQAIHGKRLLSGFGDAVPASRIAYFRGLPFLDALVRIERGETVPAPGPEQRAEARYLAELLDIRRILVNTVQVARDQQQAAARAARALRYLRQVLETEVEQRSPELVVLRVVRDRAARVPPVTFQQRVSRAHLGNAWRRGSQGGAWYGELVPVGREDEVLFVRLPAGARALRLTLRCTHVASRLRLELDGVDLGEVACPPSWTEVTAALPAPTARTGLHRLYLRRQGASRQISVPVGRTGVSTTARIQVTSMGLSAGNRASIVLGVRDLAPDTRGYNVAVIDPKSGEALVSTAFDLVTDGRGVEAARFVGLLEQVPPGMIVAVAVKDDGSLNLRPEVVRALRTVGASEDLRERLRTSYALIGVKGAAPGTAMELLDAQSPAILEVGSLLQVRRIHGD